MVFILPSYSPGVPYCLMSFFNETTLVMTRCTDLSLTGPGHKVVPGNELEGDKIGPGNERGPGN